MNKASQLKEPINEIISSSSIIGLPNLFKTKRTLFKLIWSISLVISACVCIYYQANLIIDYLDYEVVTTISQMYEPNMQFPTVTICNEKNASFQFRPVRLNLNFNDYVSEWQNHIEPFNDLFYGNCYKFNSGYDYFKNRIEIKHLQATSRIYGFILELNVENYFDSNSIIIFIQNNTIKPSSLFEKEKFLNLGATHFISLKKIVNTKLGEPYNKCLKDVTQFDGNKTLIDYIMNYRSSQYTQIECIRYCENLKYIEFNQCNCSLSSFDDILYQKCFDKLRNTFTGNCTKKFKQNFNNNDPYQLCADYCPLECDSIEFDMNINTKFHPQSGTISDPERKEQFKSYDNYESMARSLITIRIFFDELKYTFVRQQEKFKIFDLISNIGGLFGLFLGMGLLSFIEIIEVFYEILIVFRKK